MNITKKNIKEKTTRRSLGGYDLEWTCEINGDVYVSDNRRQYHRNDNVTQGTIVKNGEPLIGVLGWDKDQFTDSLYRHLNGIDQLKDF